MTRLPFSEGTQSIKFGGFHINLSQSIPSADIYWESGVPRIGWVGESFSQGCWPVHPADLVDEKEVTVRRLGGEKQQHRKPWTCWLRQHWGIYLTPRVTGEHINNCHQRFLGKSYSLWCVLMDVLESKGKDREIVYSWQCPHIENVSEDNLSKDTP